MENIHPNGPNVYAHEQYVVNGAESNTSYQVVLMIFPLDTTCSSTLIVIPTATIRTNVAGDGVSSHRVSLADIGRLRRSASRASCARMTHGRRWIMANKDKGGAKNKKVASKTLKEKREVKRSKGASGSGSSGSTR